MHFLINRNHLFYSSVKFTPIPLRKDYEYDDPHHHDNDNLDENSECNDDYNIWFANVHTTNEDFDDGKHDNAMIMMGGRMLSWGR